MSVEKKDIKILALDSSGLVASVAIVSGSRLVAEYSIQYKKTHSQTLLPMLDEIRRMVDLDLEEIDALAVAAGPGSFTGLRIGSATAKGLSLAMDVPVLEIPTLEGLAYNLYGSTDYICPILDARRGQVYTGIYSFIKNPEEEDLRLQVVTQQCAAAIEEIVDKLNELGHRVIFLGDGVEVFQDVLRETLKVPFLFAPPHMNRQRAASVAALAQIYYNEGRAVSGRDHAPIYLRLSQAERERSEREHK